MKINTEKLTSKLIYFGAIIGMCSVLVLLTYNYFLRTIRVDVMKDIVFTYSGESGNATVSAVNGSDDLNKRTQAFLDTVTYTIEPSENLSNGDTIHVIANYSESIASQYHFQAKNVEKDFVVEGLNYRYATLEDIDSTYLDKMISQTEKYIDDSKDMIIELNNTDGQGEFKEYQLIYKAFMKSNTLDVSDRIIVVYKLMYTVQDMEMAIYYTVTVPDVNDGNVVSTDLFGEKAYLTETEYEQVDIVGYIQRLYGSQFEIFMIEDPVEEIVEEELPDEQIEDIKEEELQE